jgi:hypothetical protein
MEARKKDGMIITRERNKEERGSGNNIRVYGK